MTADQLRKHFNDTFGIDKPWPSQFEVDAETYGNVCQAVFDWHIKNHLYILEPGIGYQIHIKVGLNGGIMFKNMELLLQKENEK